jgi:hypothetical protein
MFTCIFGSAAVTAIMFCIKSAFSPDFGIKRHFTLKLWITYAAILLVSLWFAFRVWI